MRQLRSCPKVSRDADCIVAVWFGIDAEEDMVDWALEHIPIDSQPRVLDGTCLYRNRKNPTTQPVQSGPATHTFSAPSPKPATRPL